MWKQEHKLPDPEFLREPSSLLTVVTVLKAFVWRLGWEPQAVIGSGSISGSPGPSNVPAHLLGPLLSLLGARERYGDAGDGPSWTLLAKGVPELGHPGVTLLCREPHGSLSKHTHTHNIAMTQKKRLPWQDPGTRDGRLRMLLASFYDISIPVTQLEDVKQK